MSPKELVKFEDYFGKRVDHSFLNHNSFLKLSPQEEEGLKEGAVLRTVKSGELVKVGEEIAGGGEGTVYSLVDHPTNVVKLYKADYRTVSRAEKLKKMIGFDNKVSGICWPCDIVETQSGVFVGFIMPRVSGNILSWLTLSPRKMREKHPRLDRGLQIDIVLELLHLFKYLHEHNILFGDVNLKNIMFDAQYHLTFVDMDCVQIGEFPCITSTAGYDSPDVIIRRGEHRFDKLPDGGYEFNRYYSDFYRTLEMENFAVSVLIYSFMMHGYVPYDYREFGMVGDPDELNDNELCMKQKFAYSTEADKVEEYANHKNIWSHFPSFLKEAFVATFTSDKRYTDDEWIIIFERYKRLLASGQLAKTDPDCMDPFPTEQVDYDAVRFMISETVERGGFAMWQAVGRIVKLLGNSKLKNRVFEIADVLKQEPTYDVEGYRFKLLYNIGVLKKVKCESVL